eukprot:9487916-Pyramimonas_sp.AAC.1
MAAGRGAALLRHMCRSWGPWESARATRMGEWQWRWTLGLRRVLREAEAAGQRVSDRKGAAAAWA